MSFLVADSTYAALGLLDSLARLSEPVYKVTRLRLDAALYETAPPRGPHQVGRPAKKSPKLPKLKQVLVDPKTSWQPLTVANWYGQGPTPVELCSHTAVWYHNGMPAVPIRCVLIRNPNGKFKTRALLCTDQSTAPVQILKWFVRRWQVEVTFQEVRTHLGVETQRHWSPNAITHTIPILMGLFSSVILLAHHSQSHANLPVRQAAWYVKSQPTFADAIPGVPSQIWAQWGSCRSTSEGDMQKSNPDLPNRMFEAVCYST